MNIARYGTTEEDKDKIQKTNDKRQNANDKRQKAKDKRKSGQRSVFLNLIFNITNQITQLPVHFPQHFLDILFKVCEQA